MSKYLYVEFIDDFPTVMGLLHTNIAVPEQHRIVKIELTPEQSELLEPQLTGIQNFGKEQVKYKEHFRLICLQEE